MTPSDGESPPKKKPYVPPAIESEEVLEQAALACSRRQVLVGGTDLKQTGATCSITDS